MTNPIDRINQLRIRVRDGDPITKEEAAEALSLMREQRAKVMNAVSAKEKKAAAPVNLNDLFN